MSYKNIVLIGAAGNLGDSVLEHLQSNNSFKITILTRKSSTKTFPPSLKVIKISDDYPANELEEAFKGNDAVLSFVGGAGIGQQTKFIDAAIKTGVKRFFPSEYGSNVTDPKAVKIAPFFQPKVDVVDYLKRQESKGLSWSSIVTGPFFDYCLRSGFLGINPKANTATIYDDGNARWSTTNIATISRALISILQNPSTTSNEYVYISSFTTSQNEVLAAAEKISGIKYQVEKGTSQGLIESGNAKLKEGDLSGIGDLIRANLYGGNGNDWEKEKFNSKLGLKGEKSLEESVEVVIKKGELVA